MAWIETISMESAQGRLRRIYDAAVQRAGKIFHVVAVQSLQPELLDLSIKLYVRMMLGPREPLSRAQREMIAVTVSRTNACAY